MKLNPCGVCLPTSSAAREGRCGARPAAVADAARVVWVGEKPLSAVQLGSALEFWPGRSVLGGVGGGVGGGETDDNAAAVLMRGKKDLLLCKLVWLVALGWL